MGRDGQDGFRVVLTGQNVCADALHFTRQVVFIDSQHRTAMTGEDNRRFFHYDESPFA